MMMWLFCMTAFIGSTMVPESVARSVEDAERTNISDSPVKTIRRSMREYLLTIVSPLIHTKEKRANTNMVTLDPTCARRLSLMYRRVAVSLRGPVAQVARAHP